MGGRGSRAGGDSRQLTMDCLQTRSQIQAIMSESDELRAAQAGIIGIGPPSADTQLMLQCKCCEQYTLQPNLENEQCVVCGWINDKYQNTHPDSLQGKNPVSLNDARRQWGDIS